MPRRKRIQIHCAHEKLVDVQKLKPNPRNPNKHPASQIKLLAKIISAQGWRAPITVSNRSGLIVRGHGRLEAALKLGLKKCPVDFQDYESDEAELADLVADNRLAELARIDMEALVSILEELESEHQELTGFDLEQITDILGAGDTSPQLTERFIYKVVIECKDKDDQKSLAVKLKAEGYECRLLIV